MDNIAIENLVIDGERDEDGMMGGCDEGEAGFHAPFALFSPDLQTNVGGPYATREHAAAAHKAMLNGDMVPYTNQNVTFTVNGKPSLWYDKD